MKRRNLVIIICILFLVGSVAAYLSFEEKSLTLSGMEEVRVGEEATFTVTFKGKPVEGAIVKVGSQTKVTGADGTVTFVFKEPGCFTLTVFKGGYKDCSISIRVRSIPIRGLFISSEHEISVAKSVGANYVQIVYFVEVHRSGHVLPDEYSPGPEWRKERIIQLIRKAHSAGLKVYLQIYPEFYGTFGAHAGELELGPVEDQALFMREMEEVALEWAGIAEELKVELFSPACELNVFISWENNMRWHQEVFPKLRSTYHGDLVQKGELVWRKYGLSPEDDLSFYDHYA
jgi:hypothetical protein